jgi:broad specificity phosphatase PhoE
VSATNVHLIRHGEVDNPHHVVYADLPGYGLSPLGHAQATAAADYLSDLPLRRVISSPLLRARQTAAAIARPHDVPMEIDGALTEWSASLRWAGVRWDELEDVFPGELTAYLKHS